jgi:Arc/MetJ-type ribon-helix-helix transcriptional regulator
MNIQLSPHSEELIREHLAQGNFHSPEEVIEKALEQMPANPVMRPKTPAEAVAHIRESRKGVRLGGLKIKELIAEGRKY